jgi:hypothetical protein
VERSGAAFDGSGAAAVVPQQRPLFAIAAGAAAARADNQQRDTPDERVGSRQVVQLPVGNGIPGFRLGF